MSEIRRQNGGIGVTEAKSSLEKTENAVEETFDGGQFIKNSAAEMVSGAAITKDWVAETVSATAMRE